MWFKAHATNEWQLFVLHVRESKKRIQKVVGLLFVFTNRLIHRLIPRFIVHTRSGKPEVLGGIAEQHVILPDVERSLEVVDVSLGVGNRNMSAKRKEPRSRMNWGPQYTLSTDHHRDAVLLESLAFFRRVLTHYKNNEERHMMSWLSWVFDH